MTDQQCEQLMAAVAHDLKNVLNPVGLYLELIRRAAARGQLEQVDEHLATIQQMLANGLCTIDRLCRV